MLCDRLRLRSEHRKPTPPTAEDVWFVTSDNLRLHGWYFASPKTPAFATIIFFHGNGGNIENVDWVAQRLSKRGLNVLLFDYRGYGESEGQALYESDLYKDGDAAYFYLLKARQVPPERSYSMDNHWGRPCCRSCG